MKYNLTEIFQLIKERRTVYPENFSSRKVHKEQIDLMLEAANWAPNHGSTEPWRFYVYSGDSKNKLLNEIAEIYKATTSPEKFLESKYNRFQERAEKTSFVIAVTMLHGTNSKIPEIEEVMATACAVQNLMLIGTAYGIGTFWATGNAIYSEKLHTYMNLASNEKCLGTIYVGYPNEEKQGKRNIWLNKVKYFE